MTRKPAASRRRPAARRPSGSPATPSDAESERWRLRLYVAGQTPKSVAAFNNLRKICEEHLEGRYEVEVIDLVKSPQRAAEDQILAIPTLVRRLPTPLKKIIGDLSRTDRVLVGFEIQ